LSYYVMSCCFLAGFFLLLCAWGAVWRFLTQGRAGLARLSPGLVKALHLGAALPLVGIAALLLGTWLESEALATLGYLTFGAPALVPYLHLKIERDAALWLPDAAP
jgi:hypothetical protein